MAGYTMKDRRRFVLNTNYQDAAASEVCIKGLGSLLEKRGFPVTHNDWQNYKDYDVAIFMSYDSEIEKARSINPNLLIGLGDPKTKNISESQKADFLLVSSIEQKDLFLCANPNTFIYYMFPELERYAKEHRPKDKIIIGYHGNKVHLNSLYPNITKALERLGKRFNIEFWAMYNIEKLGEWTIGVPSNRYLTVKHIQWAPENYKKYLSQVDIGLVPNCIPVKKLSSKKKERILFSKIFLEDRNDYLLRFKYSSNPGRIYVFSQLGIPVVADLFPSAAQFLEHGRRGFLAHSEAGWYHSIEQLILNPDLRQKIAERLYSYIDSYYSREKTFEEFLEFINKIDNDKDLNTKGAESISFVNNPDCRETWKIRWQIFCEFFSRGVALKLQKVLKKLLELRR